MSFRRVAGKVLLYLIIEVGALVGVPMRPDEIENLMRITENKVVVMKQEDEGDGKSEKRTGKPGTGKGKMAAGRSEDALC